MKHCVAPIDIWFIFLTVSPFFILFPPVQLLQGLGLNLPAGAETDQHTGSAIAVYLVLHGANVSFYNHEGKTPLDLCQDTQTAALIQQFARNAPRWVACVAGFWRQYGLRKERGARGGHARREVLSRAPFIFRSSLIPGGASVDTQERWFLYNFYNGSKLRRVGLANGSSHGRIGFCHSSSECEQVIGP